MKRIKTKDLIDSIVDQDSEVAYAAEFDDLKREGNYKNLKGLLSSKGILEPENEEIITIELAIKNEAVKDWLSKNTNKMKE